MKYLTPRNVAVAVAAIVVLLGALRLTVGQAETAAVLHWLGAQIERALP